ncbi:transporter substrate-binding domain-containing protein [Paucibacter sp. TC2R-5]|uniref:substrate-binding periplasmic protein n=1 Tax=Paucibacter sp. TC2R-5 TaxID=2893555 RepID=UPI0021E4F82E|nr:transporter substrate-binding domain-containing protein [Paucibacter sp. TC2R-5]MCV2361258.1 transporter substrate-binding domain-containing protein [Paucibacter sp. TC2R-5]
MEKTVLNRLGTGRWLFGVVSLMVLQEVGAQPSWPELQRKPVALVANDWCPQHCESGAPDKGYVVDIVTQALQSQGVPYTLHYFPWSRAMRMVDRGEVDGLLTPTVPGFPKYIFHAQAVGYQQYCFYADKSSQWRYRQPADLQNQHIAMLADSGLGEVDDYLKAHHSTITVTRFKGEQHFAKRLFIFLGLKRADTVVLSTDVFEYGQSKGDIGRNFQAVGCLEKEKMVVGLSKKDERRSQMIGEALDQGIIQLRKSGQLAKTLARYGMRDWKQ